MKDSKIIIALVAGILIGLAFRGVGNSHKRVPSFHDRAVHSYLVHQIQSAPGVAKIESLQMGFDGKSLLATVLPKDSADGYYQANGQWNFDVGSAMKLWPYEVD